MDTEISRRRLLLAMSAGLVAAPGCSTLTVPLCPGDPAVSDRRAPLTIDVHAHIFNGSDLQIGEFLAQTSATPGESEMFELVRNLGGKFLQALAWHTAPNASDERRVLDRYAGQTQDCRRPERVLAATAPAFQDGYSRGRNELQATARSMRSAPGGVPLLGPNDAGPGLDAVIADLPANYEDFQKRRLDRTSVLGSQPHLGGYVNFVLHHFNYRHVNAFDYLSTYSRNSPRKVDLLVASMVDYDWWLARGRQTETTLDDQVDIMARISLLTGGRVHGFAPFCPFREAMTRGADSIGDSLRLVQRAVQSHGFIGVKLYPPMGFAAWGNESLDVWTGKPTLDRAAWDPGFGKRLDNAMEALFKWCIDQDVPIMAHANRSNGPYEAFRALAGSEYWQLALNKFPGLRVSFGHFGDTDPEDHGGDRSSQFIPLMTSATGSMGASVFADSGYFAGVLLNPIAMANVLSQLYAKSAGGVLRERLMYGSDWTMILPLERVDAYLAEFSGVMARIDAAEPNRPAVRQTTLTNAFFGQNAAEFLGLRSPRKARQRLEKFYERYEIDEPDWMQKVG